MKYIGLILALVVSVATAFLVYQNFQQKEAPPAPITKTVEVVKEVDNQIREVQVYVAARDIPIGAKITANMITTRPWPEHLVLPDFVVGQSEGQRILETIARANFNRDEPINKTKLVNPSDPNFLAGELPSGKRVVTIQTDEIAGVAGFVFPGDHVDVLVTHEIYRENVTAEDLEDTRLRMSELQEEVTETLLYDIRVLAVDQRATGGVNEEKGIIIPRSVSLEVSLEDAQKLRLAEEIGHLSLALRSVEDKEKAERVAITRQADLSQFKLADAEKRDDEGVRVIRGTDVEIVGSNQ